MRYAVVIEKAGDNYSAYVPDLPGCVATAVSVGTGAGVARGDPLPYRRSEGGRTSRPPAERGGGICRGLRLPRARPHIRERPRAAILTGGRPDHND
jgi:hypothetical protein